MGVPFSIVCLSPQEWRIDLPTNRQQIMLRAARRGHRVLFVETGHFLGRHLWRLARGPDRASLARRLFESEEVLPGIHVRKALNVVPWGRKYRWANAVNNHLTASILRRSARALPQPAVLWIYDPCTVQIARRSGHAFAVYDCVDDYPEQAGSDVRRRALLASGDRTAAGLSKLVFATTSTLYDRQRRINPRTFLVPNVGDYEHFARASEPSFAAPEVAGLPRPVVGFAGNLTPAKVDFALLASAAAARPDWTFLLVGPVQPAAEAGIRGLRTLPNVHCLGARSYDELPRFVAAFDVGLIPYVATAYTRSCLPLKLYEYLAAGKPVVATGLPELADREPDVLLVDGVQAFVSAVAAALERVSEDDRARRMALAAKNTWETRTERLLGLVESQLA
jgi:glycosyltransferase involved in cell wall biosynthesis